MSNRIEDQIDATSEIRSHVSDSSTSSVHWMYADLIKVHVSQHCLSPGSTVPGIFACLFLMKWSQIHLLRAIEGAPRGRVRMWSRCTVFWYACRRRLWQHAAPFSQTPVEPMLESSHSLNIDKVGNLWGSRSISSAVEPPQSRSQNSICKKDLCLRTGMRWQIVPHAPRGTALKCLPEAPLVML